MSPVVRGIVAGGLQLALLFAIAGKYAVDRATLPRVWVRVNPFDPQLPIRGRYVRLQADVVFRGSNSPREVLYGGVVLSTEGGQLIATATDSDTGVTARRTGDNAGVLTEPIVYFISDRVPDPSRRGPGEELWAEVSIPKRGSPRPVRLGVKRDGNITPLNLN